MKLLHRAAPSTLVASRLTAYRYLSQEARSTIEAAVKAKPLVLFMKGTPEVPQCGFSRAVVQILDLHGVAPTKMQTYNVLADEELRAGIKEFSCAAQTSPFLLSLTMLRCREWPTIPQVYVNGTFVGGCDILIGSTFTHHHIQLHVHSGFCLPFQC